MADLLHTIYSRCTDDGGCLIWGGAVTTGSPVMRYNQRTIRVRRKVLELTGRPAWPDMNAAVTCGNSRCLNPDHLEYVTNAEKSLRIAATGVLQSVVRRRKIAEAKRVGSALTEAMVSEIRNSDESGRALAERFPICESHANQIKRGASRYDFNSPMAMMVR